MKLFPSIRPVEIVEWQDRLGIRAEIPSYLRDDMPTLHSERMQAVDFGDDANVQDMGRFYGTFTWSLSLEK